MKVALIGYGHLGKWHLDKAVNLLGVNNVCVVEPFEKNRNLALEKYPELKVFESLEQIISDIDAGLVVTPTSFHFEYVSELLKNDKHVFCEKPLSSSIDQANEIVKIKNKTNVKLQVGHSERCHLAWEIIKEKYNHYVTDSKLITINRYAPFKGRAVDVDVVQDLMIHDLDLVIYLLNEKPCEISATGQKIRTNNWDHVMANLSFESGKNAFIQVGRNSTKEVREVEFISEHGALRVDLFSNKIIVADKNVEELSEIPYEKRDHLFIEQQSFYKSISENTNEFVTVEDGFNAVELIEKVLSSLDEGLKKDL